MMNEVDELVDRQFHQLHLVNVRHLLRDQEGVYSSGIDEFAIFCLESWTPITRIYNRRRTHCVGEGLWYVRLK